MSTKPLPEQIEPLRLAQARRTLVGSIPLTRMVRLMALLNHPKNTGQQSSGQQRSGLNATAMVVNVALSFGVDEAGQENMAGHVDAQVQLQCQRCMQPMTYAISEQISLGIVLTERQAEQLSACYEPLLLQDFVVTVSELVEDEILLALPTVALHEKSRCMADGQAYVEELQQGTVGGNDNETQTKPNPFAVLSQLTNKTSKP
ncbi:MAG: hypothetical protein GXP08_17800 [Gammaproteobacteria bacterium]|nr:hypothetical protein [Gammaproteobacteria bacterium]